MPVCVQDLPTSFVSGAVSPLHTAMTELECLGHMEASCGAMTEGWFSATELTAPESRWRDGLLHTESERFPGLDEKGQWAFLVGNLAYYLSLVMAGLYLKGRQVPELAPDTLALRIKLVEWQIGDESGRYPQPCFRFLTTKFHTDRMGSLPAGASLIKRQPLLDCLRSRLESFFEPLIQRMSMCCRLSKGAGWRLVADSLAAAFLAVGRELGCESLAKTEALSLIQADGSPLKNRQTGFFDVQLMDPANPGTTLVTQTFRKRGGCCRYYTSEGGDYCSTCVLENPERRDQRLRDHLWQCHQNSIKV